MKTKADEQEAKNISLETKLSQVEDSELDLIKSRLYDAHKKLYNKEGEGSLFLGWMGGRKSLISDYELESIKEVVKELKEKIEVLVVVGIGGSYLGSRAVIEALTNSFLHMLKRGKDSSSPLILYAGHHLDSSYHHALLEFLKGKKFAINVISKSGTTTEPALAFRFLKKLLEEQEGREAKDYIIATTDKTKGALRKLSEEEGYRSYTIPDSIGGRYSVLTAVGLFAICMSGIDIDELLRGAQSYKELSKDINSDAHKYAMLRNVLYEKGKKIELLLNYTSRLAYFGEWWKQLYGESEGKLGKGLFPSTCNLTTDLHSMGQWIQEGERTIFETLLDVEKPKVDLKVEEDKRDLDKLNYLSSKSLSYINHQAQKGTALAHFGANVPILQIKIPSLKEYYLGQLIYFFEISCGLSGYILGVNPFNQPGVEAYKANMFALLGKEGFEQRKEELEGML